MYQENVVQIVVIGNEWFRKSNNFRSSSTKWTNGFLEDELKSLRLQGCFIDLTTYKEVGKRRVHTTKTLDGNVT